MNRIDICKNIIQSIKEYITTPDKLEPHRAKNHFIRKRKLSLFQVIMYLLYTSKASMFQNLSRIREDLGILDFPDISKQALSKARQFISPALFKELYYFSTDVPRTLLLSLVYYADIGIIDQRILYNSRNSSVLKSSFGRLVYTTSVFPFGRTKLTIRKEM